MAGLFQDPIAWPPKPVFSPYAPTHHHYSQIRFGGPKYLIHRVSLRLYLGQDLSGALDCSHILHLGEVTERNINPQHIVEETNIMNQTRKACACFIERWEWLWALGAVGHHGWSEHQGFLYMLLQIAPLCSFIHGNACCMAWDPAWGSRDFLVNLPGYH